MRRMWIGIGLLVVLLAVGIGLTGAFTGLHQPLAEQLEQTSQAALAEDWETAAALLTDSAARWQRCHRFTAAVADHGPMEEIDGVFAELEALLCQQDTGAFAAGCARLSSLTRSLAQSQCVTWWNLL